jgi:hypothetical protein
MVRASSISFLSGTLALPLIQESSKAVEILRPVASFWRPIRSAALLSNICLLSVAIAHRIRRPMNRGVRNYPAFRLITAPLPMFTQRYGR